MMHLNSFYTHQTTNSQPEKHLNRQDSTSLMFQHKMLLQRLQQNLLFFTRFFIEKRYFRRLTWILKITLLLKVLLLESIFEKMIHWKPSYGYVENQNLAFFSEIFEWKSFGPRVGMYTIDNPSIKSPFAWIHFCIKWWAEVLRTNNYPKILHRRQINVWNENGKTDVNIMAFWNLSYMQLSWYHWNLAT